MARLLLKWITVPVLLISCDKVEAKKPAPKASPSPQVPPTKSSAIPIEPIKRLNPTAFTSLPQNIQSFLSNAGYTIPQSIERQEPHNVISGAFINAGQVDWAVLASRGGNSELLVFPNGSTAPIHKIERDLDDPIRSIQVASPSYIRDHYTAYGGPKPPTTISHEGINDGLDGKASKVLYFYELNWLHLSGAD
jgi:hypothetical protein